MEHGMDRRRFLQATGTMVAGMGLAGSTATSWAAGAKSAAEKLGWRLGCQFCCVAPPILQHAIARVHATGLVYFEGGSRPTISPEFPGMHLEPSTPAETRQWLKDQLASAGVKMVSYYSYKAAADEAQWRKEFTFAKDMGIEVLVAEPDPKALDIVAGLCDEFQISVAIHNHPKPARYWDDQAVLEVCRGRTSRIGVCADTGHWMRSGIDPLEAVKRLEGRLISFHLKDIDGYGRNAAQVPWGAGKGNIKAILQEVHRQKAKPLFIIEQEQLTPDSREEILACVDFFEGVARELTAGAASGGGNSKAELPAK